MATAETTGAAAAKRRPEEICLGLEEPWQLHCSHGALGAARLRSPSRDSSALGQLVDEGTSSTRCHVLKTQLHSLGQRDAGWSCQEGAGQNQGGQVAREH